MFSKVNQTFMFLVKCYSLHYIKSKFLDNHCLNHLKIYFISFFLRSSIFRQGHSQDEIFHFSKLMSCHYPGRLSINNTYKICYVRKKKEEKWILLKGYGMVTEWHWMSTEWSLKSSCHSVDWMVTEMSLNGAFQFSQNGSVSSCAYSIWLPR